jgi:hypothetical protein
MAGVGRRGFAAAMRAAMCTTALAHHDPSQNRDTSHAMDGRRANAPKYLDINATMNHVMRGECFFSTCNFCICSFVLRVMTG